MIGREKVGRKRRKRGREAEMEGREIREGVLGSFEYCCSMQESYCFC